MAQLRRSALRRLKGDFGRQSGYHTEIGRLQIQTRASRQTNFFVVCLCE